VLSDKEVDEFKYLRERCDVREECLEFSLVTRRHLNIWGDMTASEPQEFRQ